MKKLTELLARGLLVCALLMLFLTVTPFAYAEYEIDTSSQDFSINVPTDGTIVQWTEDVVVSWEKPDMTASGDILNGFVYKWNTSATALDDDALNSTTNDGRVDPNIDPPSLTKDAADFTDDDSNYIRYLHIKTWYLDVSAGQPAYSDDVVIGPINIDNVAPTGAVRITDDAGNDITTTYSSVLDLRLSASVAPFKMYLSETDTRPTTGATYSTEATYELGDSTPGSKTIYAWFEDGVGNISTAPATDSVTLLAPVSISPYEPTLDLATVSEQVFAVDGNDDPYDWTIIEEAPDTGGDDVADIPADANTGNSVTVTLLNPGTFKLQAVPGAEDTLTSGTITVVKSTTKRQFTLIYNETNTSVNAISLPFAVSGFNTISDIYAIVPNCDGIQWWDAATQSYKPYNQYVPSTNVALIVGGVYFVSINQEPSESLTFEGNEQNVQFSLVHNDDNTSVNSISVPYDTTLSDVSELYNSVSNCDGIQWWDAATQSYKPYNQYVPSTNISIVKGDPFFVSVTQATLWP